MALTLAVQCTLALFAAHLAGSYGKDCIINVNGGLPTFQPLILKINGSPDIHGLHLPNPAGIVTLPVNAVVRLVCPGAKNHFPELTASITPTPRRPPISTPTTTGRPPRKKPRTTTPTPATPSPPILIHDVRATCKGGTTFTVGNTNYDFTALRCNASAAHLWRPRIGSKCHGSATLLDIGFPIGANEFIKTVEVCFDAQNLNAVWSKHEVTKHAIGHQKAFRRPDWSGTKVYRSVNISAQYTKIAQHAMFTDLLGSAKQADKYISIDKNSTQYLARGHLTANVDMVYGALMRSTFYFMNVAPQWQSVNQGNWQVVEENIRKFANSSGRDLTVYTGGYGVTWLLHVTGERVKMYMARDVNNNNVVAVPAVFWKVVHDPLSRRGVAFVAVNNPYIRYAELDVEERLCTTDVCPRVQWVRSKAWAADNQNKGFTFCCRVDEFRARVAALPALDVSGGLLT